MDDLPETIYTECTDCDDITEHTILNARLGKAGVTGTFKCLECGKVVSCTVRLPKPVTIRATVSTDDTSESTTTTILENEIPKVGDEFDMDDGRHVVITQIIDMDYHKRTSCPATQIRELWAKGFDVVKVKVSVNDGRKTYPLYTEADPDDEYEIGMVLNFENWDAVITSIKTKNKLVRRGSAEARDITRIYAHIRRHGEEEIPETGDGVMDFDDE